MSTHVKTNMGNGAAALRPVRTGSLPRWLVEVVAARVGGCGPVEVIQSAPTPIPRVRKRLGETISNLFFRGSSFPTSNGAFELDMPLTTGTGTAYYAFEIMFDTPAAVNVDLDLARLDPAGDTVQIPDVEVECNSVAPRAMRITSLSNTGREGPAFVVARDRRPPRPGRSRSVSHLRAARRLGRAPRRQSHPHVWRVAAGVRRREASWGRSIVNKRSDAAAIMPLVVAPHLVGVVADSLIANRVIEALPPSTCSRRHSADWSPWS
jgi:hypothetical protein